MQDRDKVIIREKIAPLVGRGEISLLLGAGFSVINSTSHGRLPGGDGLRDLILQKCGKKAGPKTTLKDAYLLGTREISNFNDFLSTCFTVDKVEPWQEKMFQYAWNKIYTTNIDNVLNVAHAVTRKKDRAAGEFTFFNYADPSLISNSIGTIPVVSIHGTCSKLEEGFIFSSLEYAKASSKVLDWHRDLAAKIMTGGLVVIGNQLEESDIDTYMAARAAVYTQDASFVNWIVIPGPDEIKAENYRSAGYYVIDATAQDFFEEIYASLSPQKIGDIVLETIPAIKKAAAAVKAMTWFKGAFSSIVNEVEKAAEKKGIFRHFITGSEPEWFYIINNVQAKTTKIRDLTNYVGEMMQATAIGVGVLHVIGASGSGKTTAIRSALSNLISTYPYIYEFNNNKDIDTNLLKDILQSFTEKSIFVFYSASDYYFAINFVSDRVHGRGRPYCLFILEDRSNDYHKNRRQITGTHSKFSKFEMGELLLDDAREIALKIEEYGLKYEKFSEYPVDRRARIILDKERGYGGDLLSALFSLTTHENFEQKIYQEYHSIESKVARKILDVVAIVQSLGFQLPVSYVSGFLNERTTEVLRCLNEDLAGVLVPIQEVGTVRCRHRIIANYYFENCISRSGQVDLVIGILEFLSRQFDVEDIRLHPLAYRIYKEIISFEFIYERYFPLNTRDDDAEKTYHDAQKFFTKDGIFWLHFGRFYKKIGKLDNAIDCFRMGLSFYDSFQTRHLLGTVLLEKYVAGKATEDDLYKEGVDLLETERLRRGSTDPYPTTALLDQLDKVLVIDPQNLDAAARVKDCVNKGLKYFGDDEYFRTLVQRRLRRQGGR